MRIVAVWLRALLGSIFPGLEGAFDYSNRTPLILVAEMCTPAEIRAAGTGGVTAHLTENRAWPATFASSGRLASYAGLVPVPRDSGRVSGNLRRPKRYNRRLRRVFYMAALSSLKVTDGPSRRFYDRKRSERLIHTQALLALARRLVDVLWALLHQGREFTLDTPAPLPTTA